MATSSCCCSERLSAAFTAAIEVSIPSRALTLNRFSGAATAADPTTKCDLRQRQPGNRPVSPTPDAHLSFPPERPTPACSRASVHSSLSGILRAPEKTQTDRPDAKAPRPSCPA